MSKEIIVNANIGEEIRVAIVEDKKLVDIDIDNYSRTKKKGNIFKGIVTNIEDGLDAVFIDFGENKQAFLPLSEIRNDFYEPIEMNKNISSLKTSHILSKGQDIVIQITKDKIGNKGAAATTYISIPGRYIVLMHSDNTGGGVSKKIIYDEYRREAKKFLSTIEIPEGLAVIIRTAGIEVNRRDLVNDFKRLCSLWEKIDKNIRKSKIPQLLYKEPNIIIKTIRDYFTNDISLIVIDNKDEYEYSLKYFKKYMPGMEHVIVHYNKFKQIFDYYELTTEINQLYSLKVKLISGGYIIIEQTEALVSIDVNSGKFVYNEGHEATVYKTNMEAAQEIARQLRLRDLGGIIVVDFIDMISEHHKENVEHRMRKFMYNDKAKIKISKISNNGLLEITRQRLRQSHRRISHIPCHTCKGTGYIRDIQGRLVNVLRQILEYLSKNHISIDKLITYIALDLSNILVNKKRRVLLYISEKYHVDIYIYGDIKLSGEKIKFYVNKRKNIEIISYLLDKSKSKSIDFNVKIFQEVKKKIYPSIGPIPILIHRNFYLCYKNKNI